MWETIDNQKKDYFHKISTKLVKENKLLIFEDLNIKSMIKKTGKNKYRNMKNILDSSWGTFINMLQIKVSSTESELIFVNPINTSKMCSNCGNIKENLQLKDRQYNCNKCKISIDRDYNASLNIKELGINTLGRREIKACGVSSVGESILDIDSRYDSMKQEKEYLVN